MTLPELIARVEQLEGPDREVDVAIAQALVPDVLAAALKAIAAQETNT